MIQPHLPIRLPCYDFTPVIGSTFDSSLLAVGSLASGISDSHGVTGGVYKTRERIHRSMLICDYERFQLHVVELQTTIRTGTLFLGFACLRRVASLCLRHCITCVAQIISGMMILRHPRLPPGYPWQSPQSAQLYLLATEDRGCARCGT